MNKDSIGNRMKENYENRYRSSLTRRTPVIMRLDGRAFHTLTRGCFRPFDVRFSEVMINTASILCAGIQGAKCAYIQSDEISILITDFDKLTTEAWFDYNIQKMTSVSAGMASSYFTVAWRKEGLSPGAYPVFDSRVFNVPSEEVCNYFIWRQQDWIRNSLQMLCQSYFSPKQLHGKNQAAMHEMLYSIGTNWANLSDKWKNGVFIQLLDGNWEMSDEILFAKDRSSVEQYLPGGGYSPVAEGLNKEEGNETV